MKERVVIFYDVLAILLINGLVHRQICLRPLPRKADSYFSILNAYLCVSIFM